MNLLTDAFNKRIIKPIVDKQTAQLSKKLFRVQGQLEEKSFDMLGISDRFGINAVDNKKLINSFLSWSYANVTVIAAAVADIMLHMFKVNNKGEIEKIETDPLLELLNRVNDYQTKWDLIYIWTIHLLTSGEAAWLLIGVTDETSQPTEIWPLNPRYIKPIPGDLSQNQFIKHYEYTPPGKGKHIFQPYEILFFKDPDPNNILRGFGTLEAAQTDILIDHYVNDYNKRFFENDARPGGILKTDQKLSQEVYDRLIERWENKYKGTDKANKTAILEQGLDFQVVGSTARDMDFLEQQKWIRDKIMAMFKNTKVVLGITEDVNRANAEASQFIWNKNNIKPKMQRLVDYINEFLTPRYGDNIFLGFDDPVPEAEEQKLNKFDKSVNRWITINEVREEEGKEPIEGGDFLYVPLTMIPINNAGQPILQPGEEIIEQQENGVTTKYIRIKGSKINKKKIVAARLSKRYAKEVSVIKLRKFRYDRDMKMIVAAAKSVGFKRALKANVGLQKSGYVTQPAKEAHWKLSVRLSQMFERQLVKIVLLIVKRHSSKTLANLKADYKPTKSFTKGAGDRYLPSDQRFVGASIDGMTPIIIALMREQGFLELINLGIDTGLTITQAIKRSIRRFVGRASKSWVSTLREHIGVSIAKGIEAGWSVERMQREIRAGYNSFSRPQALRLARTETIRASNFATEQAFIESGVVEGKQWVTAMDERVCPYCMPLDGKIFALGETILEKDAHYMGDAEVPLNLSYGDIPYPPLHANCRCSLSPVLSSKDVKPLNKLFKIHKQVTKRKHKPKPKLAAVNNSKLFDSKITIEIDKAKEEMLEKLDEKLSHEVEKITKAIINGHSI